MFVAGVERRQMMSTKRLALLALVGFAANGIGLVAIHTMSTGYNPTVHFVSEYANGPHVWILRLMALGSIAGVLALLAALTSSSVTPRWSAAFSLLLVNVAARPILRLFPVDPIEAAFAGGGGPQFTTSGWIHVIVGLIAAVAMMIAIVIITVRLARSGRLSGGYYALPVLAVLAPVFYVAMLATPPATFPIGLYQRGFIVCTWFWQVIVCVALLIGPLAGGASDRAEAGV
jgi:hypothetical protein